MNKYTGEVDIKIGDKSAKLVYDWKAIAAFQSKFGKNSNINDFDINQICDTLLIGLQKHNPEITKDDIFDSSPAMTYITDCIVEAFIYAQYGAEKGGEIVTEALKTSDALKKTLETK